MTDLIERILKHREVSRCITGAKNWTPAPGLYPLARLRASRSQIKQAARNVRDYIAEVGYSTTIRVPSQSKSLAVRRIEEALAAGLPEDLAELCGQYLDAEVSK